MAAASAGPGLSLGPVVLFIVVALLLLFIAGLVVSVVLLVRFFRTRGDEAPATPALEALKLRYAKGELTREQFEQMRRDIEA